jgi:hypothetical protein
VVLLLLPQPYARYYAIVWAIGFVIGFALYGWLLHKAHPYVIKMHWTTKIADTVIMVAFVLPMAIKG